MCISKSFHHNAFKITSSAAGSIDFIHAGAALHCWPEPTLAIAEISRVLRPGGAFIGISIF